MGAFMAAGLLKGISCRLYNSWLVGYSRNNISAFICYGRWRFNFLPIFLAYTAAKKFKAEPFVAMAVAAALVYPNISTLYSAGEAVSFFGIPVTLISYPCSVIPIVVAVFVQAKFEN